MKVFTCKQIREIDEHTIRYEFISSHDLMERAANSIYKWYSERFERSGRVLIFTGPGNNGGDGLALARILYLNHYKPEVYYVSFTEKTSGDWNENKQLLETGTRVPFKLIKSSGEFPPVNHGDVIIDALFGSGLTRPVEGLPADIIHLVNETDATKIAIDIPSGLFCEDNSENIPDNIIKANYTVSFEFPKISFFFAENEKYVGDWSILPIGLNKTIIEKMATDFQYIGKEDVVSNLIKRKKFDHKGIFGHGLMIGGSYGKMGAVTLSAMAALRTGLGLLTCHIPGSGNFILQTSVPEAMAESDSSDLSISDDVTTDKYTAVAIGPGMGTLDESHNTLHQLLLRCTKPLVIDADALNILSQHPEWHILVNKNAIITPHVREFERLTTFAENSYVRLMNQIKFSRDHNCVVVLKGAYTSVSTPDGKILFNSTGNPGMATGGTGDVLTGIILSLLCQGYSTDKAATIGVFLHGLAGDIAAEEKGYESMLASDLINKISNAFNRIKS